MDPQRLLQSLLGAGADPGTGPTVRPGASLGQMAGGVAAGGLLGVLVGNKKMRKKMRKLAGGAAGYGGAAALGALGMKAYQNWRASQHAPAAGGSFGEGAAPAPSRAASVAGQPAAALPAPADEQPFELALVAAMIAAANADGHIDSDEQRAVFEQVNALPLDAEDKGYVFDTLANPPSLADIAAQASGPEQATQLYLASRLAIDPDHPAEQAYLDALAGRLGLAPELVTELNAEAERGAG